MAAISKYLLEEEPSIPKWKVALAIGGAFVIGTGLYYAFYGVGSKDTTTKKQTKSKKSDHKMNSNSTSTVDNSPLGKAQRLKTEGNTHFRNQKYDEAIKCYDEAIESCPQSASNDLATFYQNRAAAYEHLKKWMYVMRDCSSALELNPRYIKALQRRARAAQVLLDLDLALEDYTAICIIESFSNQESLAAVDKLLKQIGLAHAEEIFKKPRDRLPSKYYIRSYFGIFSNDPVYKAAHSEKESDTLDDDATSEKNGTQTGGYLKALQLLKDEKYDGILQCCCNELSNPLTSHKGPATLLRGIMYSLMNDVDRAIQDFSQVADMEDLPTDYRVTALVKIGGIEASANNHEKSMAAYNRAIALDSSNSDIYHQRGQMYLMMNKIEEAIDDFKLMYKLNPDFAVGYVQKLHTEYRYATFKGDTTTTASVIKDFKEARKRFPKCSEVNFVLAQILVDEEKFEEADKLFEEVKTVDPNNPVEYVYHGLLQVQWKGDIPAAVALIQKALDIDNQCEMALENLATISVQTGKLQEGINLFNKVIPLAHSITEMAHYCSLRDAAVAQVKVVKRLGIQLPEAPDI